LLRDSDTRRPSSSKEIGIPRAAKLQKPLLAKIGPLPVSYLLLMKKNRAGFTLPGQSFLLLKVKS